MPWYMEVHLQKSMSWHWSGELRSYHRLMDNTTEAPTSGWGRNPLQGGAPPQIINKLQSHEKQFNISPLNHSEVGLVNQLR